MTRATRASIHRATVAFLALTAAATSHGATVESQILDLTGQKRTKLVWVRGSYRETLIAFDTADGAERTVQTGIGEGGAVRPLITEDGSRVVYCTGGDVGDFGTTHRVYIVNWDGSGAATKLSDDGYLASLWTDPSGGSEYAISMRKDRKTFDRIPLDPVGAPEVLWVGPSGCRAELQCSADGARSCLAPNGIGWVDFSVSPPVYHHKGSGCRPSMAPDNSYLWWNFVGAHNAVAMNPASGTGWTVSIPNSQNEAYYPRWTNKKQFMTHTNNFQNGSSAEVFFCAFAGDYRSIATSVRVTDNGVADYHPSARIFDGTLPPPSVRVDSFAASPDTVTTGGTATLSWATSNADAVSIDNGVGATSADGSVDVTPSATTTYTLTATGAAGPATAQVTVTVIEPGDVHIKVNSGSNTYDVAGWERDDAYASDGSDHVWSQATDTTTDPDAAPAEVYRSVLHEAHSYSFPALPDGDYTVRIHFVEGGTGSNRAMDYTIEGVLVLDDFQITSEVDNYEALVKSFAVTVDDGNGIQIECAVGGGNDVFEAGIEILSSGGGPVPEPNEPPTASILAAPLSGNAPHPVSFQAVADDSDGSVVAYLWDFGDGDTSNEQNPTHTFDLAGYREVTLTVTDDDGATAQTTLTVTVTGVVVESPNGGEVLYVGTTPRIRWSTSIIENVRILYTNDGGSYWEEIAPSVYITGADWGAYAWTVPDAPSVDCIVHVEGYMLSGFDQSDGTFEIRAVTDADGDGMDDGWETDQFGTTDRDGTGDFDGDGATDADEFQNATDPLAVDSYDVAIDVSGVSCAGGSGGSGSAVALVAIAVACLAVRRQACPARARRVGRRRG